MKKNKTEFLILLLGSLMMLSSVQAASFDCAKASTKVELMICENPELSKLDDRLAEKYEEALNDKSRAKEIRRAQKAWLKERNKCATTGCMQESYRERIKELSDVSVSPDLSDLQMTLRKGALGTACLKPKIDWRNYEWTLISGSGQPPCEEMLAYLKSRSADEPPAICPGERLPRNGNWTKPEIRVVSEAERQAILKSIPDQWRQKPNGPASYELQLTKSKLLRVIRGDITRDGIPEYFLAFTGAYPDRNPKLRCELSKQCAIENDTFPAAYPTEIWLVSDSYSLLPMNADGTRVDWSKVHFAPMLMDGELVYYKGRPYWLSKVIWGQASQDDFAHSTIRPGDRYSKIFGLYGIGYYVTGQYGGPVKPAPFSEVQNLRGDGYACEFGYFNRENLKQHPAREGK